MYKKFNISLNAETDFLLNKLVEMTGESRASVVTNLIYYASENAEEFVNLFRDIKLARLGFKPLKHPLKPSQ